MTDEGYAAPRWCYETDEGMGYNSILFLEGALVEKCSAFLFHLKQCQEQKYRCLPAT